MFKRIIDIALVAAAFILMLPPQRATAAETVVHELGFYNVRLRCHSNLIRIEVDLSDFSKLMKSREKICNYLKSLGFDYLTLDLEGFRSGSKY